MNINLKIDKKASLLIKPTAISILKEMINFENLLRGNVLEIEKGEILARVIVDVEGFEIEAIMLNEKLNVKKDDEVFLAFKASDVIISKVLND